MDKQIEEVFEKYAVVTDVIWNDVAGLETLMDVEQFNQAIRNGDIYLKADVERARVEGELLALKTARTILSNSKTIEDLQDAIVGTKEIIAELETKLKELK